MEIFIKKYEEKIENLEKKVSDLEKHSAMLRECLLKNVHFSTKLSNITYEMDCLLVKKGEQIRHLEQELENSLSRVSQKFSMAQIKTEMDILVNDVPEVSSEVQAVSEMAPEELTVDHYVEILPIARLKVERDANGYFKCSECDHKTTVFNYFEAHFRGHTGEKPFQCKLCEQAFRCKDECKSHIRSHDDRFKLKCTVCDAKFVKSDLLRHHAKKYHNGKGFTRKQRIARAGKRKRET